MFSCLPDAELLPYNGNCHCGAVKFTVRIPSLSEQPVTNCNCSICVRNGYHVVYPKRQDVIFHAGLDNLTEFRFASKSAVHKFCKTCGSSVCLDVKTAKYDLMAINVRLFQDIDIAKLKLKDVDFKSYGNSYTSPPLPADESPDKNLVSYPANCQCATITCIVHIPSLSDHAVRECNCSICSRNGYLFVYPKHSDVVFHSGYDNLESYSFGSKTRIHKFCRTCGSSVMEDLPAEGTIGFNVRMFQDIDPKTLQREAWDGKGLL